jgi:hypothetical protein
MALPYKALIYKFLGRPSDVSSKVISSDLTYLKDEDIQKLRQLGVVMQDLSEFMYKHTLINYERSHIYRDAERSLLHPIMASAMELYADSCSNYSKLHNKTVWITSENAEYRNQLDDLLEKIGMEERIFDWAWTVGQYGDLFVKVKARPGVGIISIDDDDHPINMSRVDVDGRLVGFFKTPLGELQGGTSTEKILPPWEYAHFRLLGVKKKRTMYNDPMMSEYKTLSIVTPEVRQISSKYGTSLLLNALPAYKRLRMAEDALLISRLSKSMLKYIYKVKVDGSNLEAVGALLDEYKTVLKRARAMDMSKTSPYFADKLQDMVTAEDVILPVWGDVGNVEIEKLGGEADIHWITDIEELRNQLAIALRCPLQLLGGYIDEVPGSLGKSSVENLDIRFARSARRLQRSTIEGVKRLCQIHLAYKGMSPDPHLFDVNMAEISTAEEQELKDALDTGVDVVEKLMDLVTKYAGDNVDKMELLDYFNQRILKLNDINFNELKITMQRKGIIDLRPEPGAPAPIPKAEPPEKEEAEELPRERRHIRNGTTDLMADTVLNESKWRMRWDGKSVTIKSELPKGV